MTSAQPAQAGTITMPTETAFQYKRVFNAPRERVWAAFTSPALIPQWWGGGTVVEEMDVRPGGNWRFVAHYPGHEQAHHGTFQEVVPPERIVTTFETDGAPGKPHIETSVFEDLGDRTGFTITVSFETAEERDMLLKYGAESGMNQTYNKLADLLATGALPG